MGKRGRSEPSKVPLVVGGALLHPACLLALGLWWLNDNVLKARYHNWVTGKLSDIACLVVFPVLVLSVIQLLKSLGGSAWMPSRSHVLLTVVAVGLLFAGVNLSQSVGHLFQAVFARVLYPFLAVFTGAADLPVIAHTEDPTDLVVLPALYFAYRLGPRGRD